MAGIKTGDTVKVIAGSHKGKTAKVVAVDRKNHRVMLEGINVVERHLRKTAFNPVGGKKSVHLGIDISNVQKTEVKEKQK